jgi:hypothetical protein
MRPTIFDDLLRDVPDRMRLSPSAAWAASRRRRLRRRVLAASLSVVAVLGLAIGLQNLSGTTQTEPAPFPGATFVRAERVGDNWEVLRSDGTTLTLDPQLDYESATLGLSPDGRWLSYAQGPESGGILDLYLLRSDQTEPVRASQVYAHWGFAHAWSPDSRLVLVPVPDGDVNVVDTNAELITHQGPPGAAAGFTDDDSLGWIRAEGSRGDEGLMWQVTDLDLASERSLPLQADQAILNPPGWPQPFLEQASLSPDRSRVAALLTNQDQARLLVFSIADGELIASNDATNEDVNLGCPLRWEARSAVLTRPGETCVVQPG